MADTNLIEEILKRTDIVDIISRYINVTKKGRSHVALCPFHDDKNPSLMISRDKQIFKCFVCGAGGNAFSFVERIEKIPFMEAVKKVASYIGYDDPRLNKTSAYTKVDDEKEMMYRAHQELTSFYRYNLTTKQGTKAKEYLENRHLTRDLQNKYSLGYAPEDGFKTIEYLVSKGFSYKTLEEAGIATHVQDGYLDRNHGRIIYPIFDEQNRPIAYSARRLNDEEDVPKYVNSVDSDIFHTSEIHYNYSHALEASLREGKVYVVEGFNDVYALARVGLDGAVALMGTALTNKHIALLRALKSEIILCLDPDEAGKKAMIKASDMLDKAHLDYSMKLFPRGENRDLDDYLNDEGEESFKTYLKTTGDKFSFLLSVYEGGERLKSARDKQKFINAFIPKLLSLDESLEKDDIIIKLARITGFEVEAIRRAVENAKNKIDENDSVTIDTTPTFQRKEQSQRMSRLKRAERSMLYYMLSEKDAVEFYEKNLSFFIDDVYRNIASFLIKYSSDHEKMNSQDIISMLSSSGLDNKDELVKTVCDLDLDETLNKIPYSVEAMQEYRKVIIEEKTKINERDLLSHTLQGKSIEEKARIIEDYATVRDERKK